MKRNTGIGLAAQGDWRTRLLRRVNALGFASISELVDSDTTSPVSAVIERTNATDTDQDPFPNSAEQLTELWRDEVNERSNESIKKFCLRTLVGELHRNLPIGWPAEVTEATAFSLIQTWTTWSAMLAPEWRDRGRSVWVALREAAPPPGWLPAGSGDPLLTEAFETKWNAPRTLRLVGNFVELGYEHHADAPRILEYRDMMNRDYKKNILNYLRSGKMLIVSPGIEWDVLDSSKRADTTSILTDGTYAWEQQLAYYVEEYDVDLPSDFKAHMALLRWRVPESIDTKLLKMP
jgi:hypothetical protein